MSETRIGDTLLGKIKKTINDWSKTKITTPVVVVRILRPVVNTTPDDFFLKKRVKIFNEMDWLNTSSVSYDVIYGAESEVIENGGGLNSTHRLYASNTRVARLDNVIENRKKLQEGIIGIQIEEASVYGSFIQLSVADFTNEVSNTVRSNDLIFVWVFDLDDLIKRFSSTQRKFTSLISLKEFSVLIDKAIFPTSGEGVKPDFSGFVTAVHKHIQNKNRTNIEGLDLTKYFQHYSVPKGLAEEHIEKIQLKESYYQDEDDKLVGVGDAFSTLNKFFFNAIIEALKNKFISLDIGQRRFTKKLKDEYFLIRAVKDININKIENKVYLTFLKGAVTIFTIHPLILLKCIYKYFFTLIGLDVFLFPDFDIDDIIEYININEIHKKNMISVGAIYVPIIDDFSIAEEFNRIIAQNRRKAALTKLLTETDVLFTFHISGNSVIYISDHHEYISKNQALFTSEGMLKFDDDTKIYSQNIFGFTTTDIVNDMEAVKQLELINFARNNIFRTFMETIDLNTLINKNTFSLRSEKFLPVNQYVSTTLNKLRDGIPLLFLIKTLFYASTGIFEPIYTWTELERMYINGEEQELPRKILNSIRNTMWIKIDFEFKRLNNRLIVKSILRNNFISHKTTFTNEIEIKEEDILEYQSSVIRYPLSVVSMKTNEGYIIITDKEYETEDGNNYINFHPSSVLAINMNGVVSNKLPIFFNSYTMTNTSFTPSIYIEGLTTEESTVLYDFDGTPSNILTLCHQDQRYVNDVFWGKIGNRPKLIVYDNSGDTGVSYLDENGTESIILPHVFGDKKIGEDDNLNMMVAVIDYINPLSILEELNKLKTLINDDQSSESGYSEYGVFNYSQYKNMTIQFMRDKNKNKISKFMYETVLGIRENQKNMSLETFIDKILNYFYKRHMQNPTFWSRKLPTRLFVIDKYSSLELTKHQSYKELFYSFKDDCYGYLEGETLKFVPYLKNTEVTEWIYAIKMIISIYTVASRYYDELLATQSIKSSIYIPASININVGDKVFIVDDRKKIDINKVGRIKVPFVGDAKTAIGITDENVAYLPEEIRSSHRHEHAQFCWKRTIYIGDAGGTSGFTRKCYLTNNPFNWVINFEEKDLTTRLAGNIQNKLGLYEVLK